MGACTDVRIGVSANAGPVSDLRASLNAAAIKGTEMGMSTNSNPNEN